MRFVDTGMKKATVLVTFVIFGMLALAACSSSSTSSKFDASNVACNTVATQLSTAQADLTKATDKAKSDNTPNHTKSQKTADQVQTKVQGLQARQLACNAATPPYHQRTPSQCDAGFNVKWDPNLENDLVSGGAPKDKYPAAVSVVKYLSDVMKHESRVLYMYYITSPEQKLQPLKSEAELRGTGVNDGCYSAKGQQVYNMQLTEFAHAKVLNVKAPAVGVNTGANPGGGAFQTAVGPIGGNLDAVQITYENKQTVFALRRCLNVELPTPIPNVPVQHPKPTPTPTPSTTTPCGNCHTTPGTPTPTCTYVIPGVCASGKNAGDAPPPPGGKPVITPTVPGGYCERGNETVCYSTPYVPPSQTQSSNSGQGDSGPGATNTTQPPETHSSAPAPPITDAPTSNPPKP